MRKRLSETLSKRPVIRYIDETQGLIKKKKKKKSKSEIFSEEKPNTLLQTAIPLSK